MVPRKTEGRDEALERELAELRADYEKLRDRKVRLEQDLAHLGSQMKELEEAALAEFGTADPAALERLLEERRAGNERLVAEYRKHLQTIHESLSAVEAQGSADSGQ